MSLQEEEIDSDGDDYNYLEYVTDEEEKYGFWYYGDVFNLGLEESSCDEVEYDDDVHSDSDYIKFQRVVLLPDKLDQKKKKKPLKSNLIIEPWSVNLIHVSRLFSLFFIDGRKDHFYMVKDRKWKMISFEELFSGKERNGVEFNRILCTGSKLMLFEMNDRSVYCFYDAFRVHNGWKKLDFKSSDIKLISSSVHSEEIAIVKEAEPFTLCLYEKENITKIATTFKIAKLFTPFIYHTVLDSENRYFQLQRKDNSFEYIPTPFEKISPTRQLVGGFYFCIALLENGTVWAAGINEVVLTRNQTTYYQIDISFPHITSVSAFGYNGVISTPSFHLFFGDMSVNNIQKKNLKRHDIKSLDLKNINIIETENKYLNVEGSLYQIFVYRKTYKPILFPTLSLQLFKKKLLDSLQFSVYYDISFECVSNSLCD